MASRYAPIWIIAITPLKTGRGVLRLHRVAVRRVNRITRGWSNTYPYRHSTRLFGRQQVWLQNRVRRWLWRKYDCTHGLFSFFTDERLLGQYQLWPLPRTCAWRR